MEAVKLKMFGDLWRDLQEALVLEASVRAFLDFLRTKSATTTFGQGARVHDYCVLLRQNRERLFRQLSADLANAPDGYDMLLEFVQRDAYKWLHDKYTSLERVRAETLEEIAKALKYGNVPSKPKFYVERRNLINEIKAKILQMDDTTRCSKINVYGMDGIGKTNLVAACVRDPEILARAKYKVYWIDLKDNRQCDLAQRMYELYHKLQIDDGTLAGLPADKPTCAELMKDRLHNLFLRPAYNRAIIVLDNVSAPTMAAIACFGVCRLLIVSQERFDLDECVQHVHLQDTFSDGETLDIFRTAVDGELLESEHLSAIVGWCRGDPTMAILCANVMVDRRQSLLKSEEAWKRFKNDLCTSESKLLKKRNQTIKFRLSSLDKALYMRYVDLAIFVADVNITSSVLALLWNESQSKVEDVMLELCNKSLVVSEYNEAIDSYVYGVHHVLLNYLQTNNARVQHTHRALIQAYRYKYTDYHKFPDDNYIYQYIGYHLQEAGLIDDFAIYLDLKFIGAKIRATGIADVLRDYDIYYDNITRQNPLYEEIARCMCDFVERYGQNLECYPHTSIIQSALQLPADNVIYRLAHDEMKKDCFGLYFNWLSPKKNKYHIHQLSIKHNLKVACFTRDDSNYLLIGTENGDIELWDQHYDRVLQEYKSHTGPVTYLRAAERKFLSISHDGTVKVWKLDGKSRRNSCGFNNSHNGDALLNIPSPACMKQKNHQNFFGSNFSSENCVTYSVEGDSLISADFCNDLLVAGSSKGKLLLWRNEEQQFEKDIKEPITSVQFSRDFAYIYVAYKSDVLVYSTLNGDFISKACCKMDILSLHTLQYENVNEFIAIQEKQVVTCTIKWFKGLRIEIEKNIIMQNTARNVCSSMTDKYLVIGSDDNKIHMWDLQQKCMVEELNAQYGNVICIDATTNLEDNSIEILLTGFEDRSVKLWHINPGDTAQQQSESVDAYAAYWSATGSRFVTAIARKNKLLIADVPDSTEIEAPDAIVTVVDFQRAGFVYGLQNGNVYLYMAAASVEPKPIMSLKDDISYLECVDDMIIAATLKGALLVYRNGGAHKLQEFHCGDGLDRVKGSFCLHDKLFVVSERKISYWDLTFDKVEVLFGSVVESFGTATVSPDRRLCVTAGAYFTIFTIDPSMRAIPTFVRRQLKANQTISACCFSRDDKYLALGTQSGDIEIWTADSNQYYSTLALHQLPVQYLQFANEGPILLSLAEQIAWWNVKESVAPQIVSNTTNRRSFRSRSNSDKRPAPLANLLTTLDLSDVVMLTKRGAQKEYLLSAIKLHGTYASRVVHSPDFRAFLTVDNVGNLYHLRMVEDDAFSDGETPLL